MLASTPRLTAEATTTAHPIFVNLLIDFSINFFPISHLYANALSQRSTHVAAHEATKLMRWVELFTSKSTYRYRVHIYKPCPRQVNGKTDFSHETPVIPHSFLQSGSVLVDKKDMTPSDSLQFSWDDNAGSWRRNLNRSQLTNLLDWPEKL